MESTTSLYTNFNEKIKQTHIIKCLISNSIIKSNINHKKHLLKNSQTNKNPTICSWLTSTCCRKKNKVVFQTGWDLARHHHWATFCPMESPAAPENLLMVTWGAFQIYGQKSIFKKIQLTVGICWSGQHKNSN